MKNKINKYQKSNRRMTINAEDIIDKVDIRYLIHCKPVWVNDGSGNGWFVYSNGACQYCYIR